MNHDALKSPLIFSSKKSTSWGGPEGLNSHAKCVFLCYCVCFFAFLCFFASRFSRSPPRVSVPQWFPNGTEAKTVPRNWHIHSASVVAHHPFPWPATPTHGGPPPSQGLAPVYPSPGRGLGGGVSSTPPQRWGETPPPCQTVLNRPRGYLGPPSKVAKVKFLPGVSHRKFSAFFCTLLHTSLPIWVGVFSSARRVHWARIDHFSCLGGAPPPKCVTKSFWSYLTSGGCSRR